MEPSSGSTKDPSEKAGWRGYAQIALIVAFVAVALYFARSPDPGADATALTQDTASSAPTVHVVRPEPTETALKMHLTGSVRLEERIKVASEVPGRVVWVSPDFVSGGLVKANEPILRIDPARFELNVRAAEAAVRSAEADLDIAEAKTGEAVEAIQAPTMARAKAQLEIAQIAQMKAELELEQATISLPFDVRVVSTDASIGALAGPAELVGRESRLGSVYRLHALQVKAPIDVEDLRRLEPAVGRTAQVFTAGDSFEVAVVRMSSVVAPKSRLTSLFLKFSDAIAIDSLPLPGTFVEIVIEGPSHSNVFDLPENVLQENGRVWVVRNGAMEGVVPKAIGPTSDGIAVEAFDAGDGIVVGSLPGARDGLQVVVSESPAAE